MLNETFYLDGVDARKYGIRLQSPLEFDAAEPVLDTDSVDGRNGDLVSFTGSYDNRGGFASCFALEKNVINSLNNINRWLMQPAGYRRLESSDDPDHFYLAFVENAGEIAQRARLLAPFDIDFNCKPQRFRKDGEKAITFTEPGVIDNPAMPARPLIRIYGFGKATISIGGYVVEILNLNGSIILDSEEHDAYNEYGSLNNSIYAEEFPILNYGRNEIAWTGGITHIEIVPRWWDL